MMQPNLPEISVTNVAAKLSDAENAAILLDVRELHELNYANLGDGIEVAPLSQLSSIGIDALPAKIVSNKDAEVIVFCHHGMRSMQVVGWLHQLGYTNAINMAGGIHAWAIDVDPSVGMY